MATTTAAPPGTRPCARTISALHLLLHGLDHAFGELRVGAAGLVRADAAGQHAHADQERLLVGDQARAIELLLEIVGAVELGGDDGSRGWCGRAGCRRSPASSTASSTRRRLLRMRDSRGAVPMMAAISSSRRGFCFRQREQLHAGRQLGQEAVEADQGKIGIGGLGERLDQRRLHLGQQLAGARAAHGGVAAVMPAAHRRDDRRAPRVAHAGRASRRCRDRRTRPQTPCWRLRGSARGCARTGERSGACTRSSSAGQALPRRQRCRQSRRSGRAPRACRASVGQRLRLLVGDHLQAMLDGAQEAIGLRRARRGRRR